MYIFEAVFQNMDNGNERRATIKLLDDRPEELIYIEVMRVAFQMKREYECLCSLEFIAC